MGCGVYEVGEDGELEAEADIDPDAAAADADAPRAAAAETNKTPKAATNTRCLVPIDPLLEFIYSAYRGLERDLPT